MGKLLRVYRCIVCGNITGCLTKDKKETFSNCRYCKKYPCDRKEVKKKTTNGNTGLCRICGNY